MLKRLIAGALVALAALSSHATAQSWKQLQWGLNTADSPYQVGVNLSGSWYRFATVTPGGAFSLSDVSIPASSITSGTLAAARLPAFSGDVTTPLGSSATTLATVNGNVGSFGSTTQTPQVTVDAKGRVTAVANVTVTPAVGSITGLGSGVASALGNAAGAENGVATLDSAGGMGAFRNRLINGNFDVWQRGTSVSVADASGPYLADRWMCWNYFGVTATVSKVAAPSGFVGQQALNIVATGVAATKGFWLMQRMEARALADLDGKNIVLSFDINATTSAGTLSGEVRLVANTAVDNGTWSTILFSTAPTVPAGTGRVSVAIPAANTVGIKNGAVVYIGFAQTGATGNVNVSLGAVQFEADRQIAGAWNNPTKFEFRPLSVETMMCMRFYYRRWSTGTSYDVIGMLAANTSAAVFGKLFDLPVEMRSDNATVGISNISHITVFDAGVTASYSLTAFGSPQASKRSVVLFGGTTVGGSPGFTIGQAIPITFNTSAGWIDVSAEL